MVTKTCGGEEREDNKNRREREEEEEKEGREGRQKKTRKCYSSYTQSYNSHLSQFVLKIQSDIIIKLRVEQILSLNQAFININININHLSQPPAQ